MPILTFNGKQYDAGPNDTVLGVLLRHGEPIPYSCTEGYCHTCTLSAVKGNPSPESQNNMTPKEKASNCFLSCICKVENDLEVAIPGKNTIPVYQTRVVLKTKLNDEMVRLKLLILNPFSYKAGQFINIHKPDGIVRSYSLASVPQLNESIELHIQKIDGGKMSPWLADTVQPGDTVEISGPHGECFYTPGKENQPLLMIATGSGLAPLWGIVRDAIRQNHTGEIHLFHGSREPERLYYFRELRALARNTAHFHYYPCISGKNVPDDYQAGRANQVAMEKFPSLKGMRLFLCGHPGMVESMTQAGKAAGLSDSDILADPFVFSH